MDISRNNTEQYSLENDLNNVVNQCHSVWAQLKSANIFITGGTGFIGRWFLESLLRANHLLDLDIKAVILTRNLKAFRIKAPHIVAFPGFSFVTGNVADFTSPNGDFTHMVHAATDASANLNETDPQLMFDTIVKGTKRSLEFAIEKSIDRVLFLSSGAVYGQQPWEMEKVSEIWRGSFDCLDTKNTYAEAKRAAEMLCAIYVKQFGMNITVARIFSTIGPFLPINTHFAIGNFIRDAIEGKPIIVKGNGLPCRSYLYVSDLIVWLLHLLVSGRPGKAYNVGSNESVSIRALAERISVLLGNVGFQITGEHDKGWNLGRYVPDTTLITDELGVARTVCLDDAIIRTALWNGWHWRNDEII